MCKISSYYVVYCVLETFSVHCKSKMQSMQIVEIKYKLLYSILCIEICNKKFISIVLFLFQLASLRFKL